MHYFGTKTSLQGTKNLPALYHSERLTNVVNDWCAYSHYLPASYLSPLFYPGPIIIVVVLAVALKVTLRT